jgi:hypothetical protein
VSALKPIDAAPRGAAAEAAFADFELSYPRGRLPKI